MGRVKKLLDQSLRPLIIYALIVLIVSIPAYFLIIDWIWERELDKHHYAIKAKLDDRFSSLNMSDSVLVSTIHVLNTVQPGFSISETQTTGQDSLYTLIRFDTFMQDREQFRCLITYISINDKSFRVLIETNMEEIDETILAISSVTFFFFMLLLAGFIYLNRRTALRIWKPFYDSLTGLRSFSLEKGTDIVMKESDVTEFNDLNQSLRTLIDANLASYRQQKEFTENASHELQTPLAIVKSKLDMLLQSRSLDADQMQIAEEMYGAINRVSRINKNLLLLAKIENVQFDEKVTIPLSQMLDEMMRQFADLFESKMLTIVQDIAGKSVEANRVLVEILLTNLLVNAVKYSPPGGEISIVLTTRNLIISNTGSQPLNEENLFRRFAQASAQHSGSGLGLAIAREICERYRWRISYRFAENRQHFTIDF
jgi:two-component system sensor histidine kinase QseC